MSDQSEATDRPEASTPPPPPPPPHTGGSGSGDESNGPTETLAKSQGPLPGTYGDEEFAMRVDGYKVKVDRELCIGAASCVALAPEIFELDSEGIAIITNPDGDSLEALIEAAKSCPTNAIIVEDAEGNQIWP